ncbi:cellulose binding domain-containing protein [Catellatospora sp. KI3]|uniref:cellulose binding domain-containing protein n=1 Tax=Catellatospora sp. KI3 TaxID=3041620 RepID=UPI0024823EED|nr:cellulose binding domain-containing protein [Catellatospora sp. KI3]MDI1464497.1 cellulose binding domain-containing protein [Catellatospora sp. KI3]
MARRWVGRGEPASWLAVTLAAARAAALTTGLLLVWPPDGLAWLIPGTLTGLLAALCLRLPRAGMLPAVLVVADTALAVTAVGVVGGTAAAAVAVGAAALGGAAYPLRGVVLALLGTAVVAATAPDPVVLVGMPVAAAATAAAALLWRGARARVARDRLDARAEAVAAERARVAREMHDSLSKTLDAIALGAAALPQTLAEPDRATRLAEVLRDGTLNAARDARAIIDGLRAHPADAPLPEVVRAIAGQWSAETGIALELDLAPVDADPQTAVDLCWILREALRNTARHAGAGRVVVRLGRDGSDVLLAVADDGTGITDPSAGRYGLVGMAERAAGGGGRLEVTAATGGGTLVSARMPAQPPRLPPLVAGMSRPVRVAALAAVALLAAASTVALAEREAPLPAVAAPTPTPTPTGAAAPEPPPSATGTRTPAVGASARPTTGAVPRPSASAGRGPSAAAEPPTAGACRVRYSKRNEWNPGFIADVTVTNTGATTFDGWTVLFSFTAGQRLTSGWSATVSQSGERITANDGGNHPVLAPGETVTFGVQGTWSGANPAPPAFTLNGVRCAA